MIALVASGVNYKSIKAGSTKEKSKKICPMYCHCVERGESGSLIFLFDEIRESSFVIRGYVTAMNFRHVAPVFFVDRFCDERRKR